MSEAVAARTSGSTLGLLAVMVTLAALDFAGTVFATEWAERHHP